MEIICPVNNKGGVGKTTITKTLGEYFSIVMNKRVCIIDMDPQVNISRRYLKMEVFETKNNEEGFRPPIHPQHEEMEPLFEGWDGRSSISDIFFGKPVIPYSTYIENLDILTANSEALLDIEHVRKDELAQKIHNRLSDFLSIPEVRDAYDIVIIDTPPAKGPLTISAIRAATQVIIPSVMEPQPLEGIYGMLQLWKQEKMRRDSKNPINLMGILPNMFTQTTLNNDMLNELINNPNIVNFVIPHKLNRRVVFAEVDAEGAKPTSIFRLPDNNLAKVEALAFCNYVNERISNHG